MRITFHLKGLQFRLFYKKIKLFSHNVYHFKFFKIVLQNGLKIVVSNVQCKAWALLFLSELEQKFLLNHLFERIKKIKYRKT